MAKGKLRDLLTLLKDERQAIRTGELARLDTLAARKDQLLADIAQLKLSAQEAMALRESADRNARLLQAAIRGVRDARDRLAALQSARDELNVYSADGARRQVAAAPRKLERKA